MELVRIPLLIRQRLPFRRRFRFRSGAHLVDLTGYEAIAQIWNADRTVQYEELDVVWLDRQPEEDGWHLRLELPEERTLEAHLNPVWDLRLIPPGDADPFYPINKSPVAYMQNYSDA